MIATSETKRIPAAGYIRMSTLQQEDSPKRQRREIESIAERGGYEIIVWYTDEGISGLRSDNRPEFQRMLADARQGTFRAVIVHELSRMSREGVFDAMAHWKTLRDSGVTVVDQNGPIDFDDMGGFISTAVKQIGANEESKTKAKRSVSGKRSKAQDGIRCAGTVFAYDREIIDHEGKVRAQVNFREPFACPKGWRARLVPSNDVEAVEAVQWAFEAAARGKSLLSIMWEFKRRGIRTAFAGRTIKEKNVEGYFTCRQVKRMLTNPVYCGILEVGRHSRGKFARVDKEGLIIHENAHPAIIDPQLFSDVQQLLKSNPGRRWRNDLLPPQILVGLLTCHHCGRPMYGRHEPRANGKWTARYVCGYNKPDDDPNCPHPTIKARLLHAVVLKAIRDNLLTDKNLISVRDMMYQRLEHKPSGNDSEQRKMAALEDKIRNGIVNMGLLSPKNASALDQQLNDWREQLEKLRKRIDARMVQSDQPSIDLNNLTALASYRDRLHEIPSIELRAALAESLDRVDAGRDYLADDGTRWVVGAIYFSKAVHPGGQPIRFRIEDDRQPRWKAVAEFVIDSPDPVRGIDVANHFGFSRTRASQLLAEAKKAGAIVRKHRRAWAAPA